MRVLPTMAMKVFRLRLMKLLKIPPDKASTKHGMQVWTVMDGNLLSKLDLNEENQEISWCGIEEGSRVVVYTTDA